MVRADTVTSLVLIAFGLGVVGEAWRMPRFTEFGSSIWSAPGVVPAMIGAALALMGVALFVRSRALSAAAESAAAREAVGSGDAGERPDAGVWLRVGVAFALCLGFAGGLVGWLPFLPAAFLFILVFTLIFDRNDQPDAWKDPRRLLKRVLLAAVVAGVAAFAIATIFEDIFLVRLP